MAKMWAGVTAGNTDPLADDFNSSIRFDQRMFRQDITGSIAHAEMLAKEEIISEQDCRALVDGLAGILEDLETGTLSVDESCEDIHMFVEQVLTERIGETGKKLHTARSRNDQVALDLRMHLRDECDKIAALIRELLQTLCDLAEQHEETVMPGYTHLQRAQPVSFGYYMMAYAMMLLRDLDRLKDCRKRINISPIGSCALAGTTYDTDRYLEAELLGFDGIAQNSMDGVSDRDFALALYEQDGLITTQQLIREGETVVLKNSPFSACRGEVTAVDYRKQRAKVEFVFDGLRCASWVCASASRSKSSRISLHRLLHPVQRPDPVGYIFLHHIGFFHCFPPETIHARASLYVSQNRFTRETEYSSES